MTTIQNLPQELLQLILLKIDSSQIYKECKLVCSDWNNIIKTNQFFQEYINEQIINNKALIDNNQLSKEILSKIHNNLYSLVQISIYESSSYKNIYTHHLNTLSNHYKCFWCSSGTNAETNEYLIYGISFDIGIIRQCHINFWENELGTKDKYHFPSIGIIFEFIDCNNKIFYSEKYIIDNEPKQIFQFMKPIFLTKYDRIKINFIGKRYSSFSDKLFYLCVSSILFFGNNGLHLSYKIENNKFIKMSEVEINKKNYIISLSKEQIYRLTDWCHDNKNMIGEEAKQILLNYFNLVGKGMSLTILAD